VGRRPLTCCHEAADGGVSRQTGRDRSRRRVRQQPPRTRHLRIHGRIGHQPPGTGVRHRTGIDVGGERRRRRQIERSGGARPETGVRVGLVHAGRVRTRGGVRVGTGGRRQRRVEPEPRLPGPGRRLRSSVVTYEHTLIHASHQGRNPPKNPPPSTSIDTGDGGLSSSDWERRLNTAVSSTYFDRNAFRPCVGENTSTTLLLSNLLYAPSLSDTRPASLIRNSRQYMPWYARRINVHDWAIIVKVCTGTWGRCNRSLRQNCQRSSKHTRTVFWMPSCGSDGSLLMEMRGS
jgi:hypothetical protein